MLITTKLDEKTALIKHYLKSNISSTLAIGKELTEISEQKLYKQDFDSFDDFVKDTFNISRQYAYNFIKIYKKYGNNVKAFDRFKDLGMTLLIVSLYVPDEKLEEVLDTAQSLKSEGKHIEDISREIKRLGKVTGTRVSTDKEEHILRLKRQFDALNDTLKNVRIAFENWLEGANRYKTNPEISPLLKEAIFIINLLDKKQ